MSRLSIARVPDPAPPSLAAAAQAVVDATAAYDLIEQEYQKLLQRTHYREVEWEFEHSYGLSQGDWTRFMRLQDERREAEDALKAALVAYYQVAATCPGQIDRVGIDGLVTA